VQSETSERARLELIVQIPCFNDAGALPVTLADSPTGIQGSDCVETLVVHDGAPTARPRWRRGAGTAERGGIICR
jgi:hypothetical protein